MATAVRRIRTVSQCCVCVVWVCVCVGGGVKALPGAFVVVSEREQILCVSGGTFHKDFSTLKPQPLLKPQP